LGANSRQRLQPPPPVSLALWVRKALEVAHHQGGVTGLRQSDDTGRKRFQPPPPVSLTGCVRMALEVTHHQGGVTGLGHLGGMGQQRFQPPPPVSLVLCVRMALEVTHHQGGVTGLRHLNANSRQRLQPPPPAELAVCTRSAIEVTHCALSLPGASASTASTPSPSAPSLHPTATHHPHSTTGASDGIDPAGGSTGAGQADSDVTHATIPRAGVCSCATATAPLGRRERWCGAAGVGDGARSGTREGGGGGGGLCYAVAGMNGWRAAGSEDAYCTSHAMPTPARLHTRKRDCDTPTAEARQPGSKRTL
jgi:hypothetical protein